MVKFHKAGRHTETHLNDKVFLTCHDRVKSFNHTIFHRNDYGTNYKFPLEFFREHFKYDRHMGIYRTNLCYKDIVKYAEVFEINAPNF